MLYSAALADQSGTGRAFWPAAHPEHVLIYCVRLCDFELDQSGGLQPVAGNGLWMFFLFGERE